MGKTMCGGVSALDEMIQQNVGKSIYHFVRVKGLE